MSARADINVVKACSELILAISNANVYGWFGHVDGESSPTWLNMVRMKMDHANDAMARLETELIETDHLRNVEEHKSLLHVRKG